MNVQPGASFEAVLDSGEPGLAGVTVEVNDNLGTVVVLPTAPVNEIAPGVFSAVLTAPAVSGQFSIIWKNSTGEVLGVEDLFIAGAVAPPIIGPPVQVPFTGGMTYKQIQDECCNFRFGEGRRNSVKLWINRRYQAVWGLNEWPFKRVNRQTVVTLNGLVAMPVGFRRAISLEDQSGNILEYSDPETFRSDNPVNATVSGLPTQYTVWNKQIIMDAPPSDGTPFVLSYLRRICVVNKDGYLVEGLLVNDDDKPIWDPEHHFLLVLGATSTGLKLENDFTYSSLEEEFGAALLEMQEDLMPPDTVGTMQYGADDLS